MADITLTNAYDMIIRKVEVVNLINQSAALLSKALRVKFSKEC